MPRTTPNRWLRAFGGLASGAALVSACDFDSAGYGRHPGSVAEGSSEASTDGALDDASDDPATDDRGADDRGADDHGADDHGGSSAAPGDAGTTSSGAAPGEETSGDAGPGEVSSDGSGDGDEVAICPDQVFTLLWADQAVLGAPMELVPTDANMDPDVAASAVAESGTVSFSIDFACAGEYVLWGLVWDYDPGAYGTDDPDSLYVGVGGPEQTWRYGCQTGSAVSGLSWQPLTTLDAQPCDASPLLLEVADAGTVAVQFRNREAGGGSQVAGIAAIVVASDATADPADLYAPY
jgi:hypothetical protein